MTIRRGAFIRSMALSGVAPAVSLRAWNEPADATLPAKAPAPAAGSDAWDDVTFYIAGWERPDTIEDGAKRRIAVRINRGWRASRY